MTTPPFARRTRGITLIEVMVALVLVAVGLLGIAGASALLLRAATAHATERRATRIAELRIAALAAGGCGDARDGWADDATTGTHEQWRTQPAMGALFVDHQVDWTSRGVQRRSLTRTALLC